MLVKIVKPIGVPKVSLLLLSRPPVNAFNTALLQQVTEAIQSIEKETAGQGAGVVIAAEHYANSSVFSAGLDLSEMYQKSDSYVETFWESLQNLWLTLYASPLATVCALNGHSPAGGCLTALACDFRVACNDQPKALMGLNEAKFGLIAPPWFAFSLQSVVGTRKADRMLQLGELVTFEHALDIGLVDELVPKTELVDTAIKRANEWASNGPWDSRAQSKLLLRSVALDALRKNTKADTARFLQIVKSDVVQENLGKYIASLSKGTKPKA